MAEKYSEVAKIISKLCTLIQSEDFRFMDSEFDNLRISLVRVLESCQRYASSLKPDVHGNPENFRNLFVAVTKLVQESVSLTLSCRSAADGKEAWIKYYAKVVEKFNSIENSLNKGKLELTSGHTLFPSVISAANTIQPTLHLMEDATAAADNALQQHNRQNAVKMVSLWLILTGVVWLGNFYFRSVISKNAALSLESYHCTNSDSSIINSSKFSGPNRTPSEYNLWKINDSLSSPEIIFRGVSLLSGLGLPLAFTGFSAVGLAVYFVQRHFRRKRQRSANQLLVKEIETYAQDINSIFAT